MQRSSCPIGCALDVIGDRWSLLILRDALFRGCVSYGDFQSSPENISTNILASRLMKLTELGIFEKKPHPTHGLKFDYHLTEKGKALKEVVLTVGAWGSQYVEGSASMEDCMRAATPKDN